MFDNNRENMWRISCDTWLIIFTTLTSIILRLCITFHSYSGESNPPMYGDYEAQRHWMEITANLPVKQWYIHGPNNNLSYWGLDYPPLTAYHMFVCGTVSNLLNPNYTRLHTSHGYESEKHKFFMRYTVLLVDFIVYIPALIYYYWHSMSVMNASEISRPAFLLLSLLYPGQILIDHGHFQYNCVSLGLFVFATTLLLENHHLMAAACFTLSLNYKQMELYHSSPFFLYLLSTNLPKSPQRSFVKCLWQLFKIAAVVLTIFLLLWLPFILNVAPVLDRIFPIGRGIFEDKVSNFWCLLNVVYKIRHVPNQTMFHISLCLTIVALFPSSVDLFLRPNRRKFVLATINSALAFYLFSFQVHEKSILLVAIPILLYLPQAPLISFWFTCLSVLSMTPLLFQDKLQTATFGLMLIYVTSFWICIKHKLQGYQFKLVKCNNVQTLIRCFANALRNAKFNSLLKLHYNKNFSAISNTTLIIAMFTSLIVGCTLPLLMCIVKPPNKYPHLLPLLISLYCSVHFLLFFVYFNLKQIKVHYEYDTVVYQKKFKYK